MITGADIVGELIREQEPILAIVPLEKIKGGRLDMVDVPAILVRTISSIDQPGLELESTVRVVDRVSATVRACDYDQQLTLIGLLGAIATDFIPAMGAATNISIRPAGRSPDMEGPGETFEQAHDFRVTFTRPAV